MAAIAKPAITPVSRRREDFKRFPKEVFGGWMSEVLYWSCEDEHLYWTLKPKIWVWEIMY